MTITGINISSNSRYVDMTDASYITIENSTMREPGSNPVIKMDGAAYSILRGNDILGNVSSYQDVVQMRRDSRFNLIENNQIFQATHALIVIQGNSNFDETDPHNNIIRNNVFNNEVHHCTDVTYGANNNVFEGNVYEKCGAGDESLQQSEFDHGSSGEALRDWQPNGIYRYNTVMFSGDRTEGASDAAAFGGLAGNFVNGVAKVTENRVYNNTFTQNYDVAFRLGTIEFANSTFPASEIEYGNNAFKNNILYDNGIPFEDGTLNKNGDTAIKYVRLNGGPSPQDDVWAGNLIENLGEDSIEWRGTSYTVAEAEANFPSDIIFSDNIAGDPLFVDSANFDFQLSANSPAIDAGVFLTVTTGSGSNSNSVNVDDARYFIDGFGIVDGDTIQIGSDEVMITAINYDTNTLTLDRSISWSSGAGVSFPYEGNAPDIGAFEFTSGGGQNSSPTDMSLDSNSVPENSANGTLVGTITTTDPDANETFSYVLTNAAGGRFAINGGSGQITVANGSLLDFETAGSHAVTVQVTDSASNTYSEPFTINVTDVPEGGGLVLEAESASLTGAFVVGTDAAASGGQYIHVPEGTESGGAGGPSSATFTFNVTQAGDYKIRGGVYSANGGSNSFYVQVDGGTNNNIWDTPQPNTTYAVDDVNSRGVADPFIVPLAVGARTIVINLREDGTRLDNLELVLVGAPSNSAPTDMALAGNSVPKNSANGTVVGTVTTTDPDTGETFSYVLTDNAGGRFAINATSGQITVADGTLLNFETATSHAVTVQVTDSANNTYSESFTIGVTDVPEGAVWYWKRNRRRQTQEVLSR